MAKSQWDSGWRSSSVRVQILQPGLPGQPQREWIELSAYQHSRIPGLAVHEAPGDLYWVITHVPSGLAVVRYIPNRTHAQRAAVELHLAAHAHCGMGWDIPGEELAAAPCMQWRADLTCLRYPQRAPRG